MLEPTWATTSLKIQMIIICGVRFKTSKVRTIENLFNEHEIVAISRNEKHKGKNITNINVQNYDDLPEIIENLNGKKIMFGLTMSQIFEMNYF